MFTSHQEGLSFLNRISNLVSVVVVTALVLVPEHPAGPPDTCPFYLSYSWGLSPTYPFFSSSPEFIFTLACILVFSSLLIHTPSPTSPPYPPCAPFFQFSLHPFSSLIFSLSLVFATHLFIDQKIFIERDNNKCRHRLEICNPHILLVVLSNDTIAVGKALIGENSRRWLK